MKKIRVNLENRSYDIIVGRKILAFIGDYLLKLNIGKNAFIITNSLVRKRYGDILASGLKKCGFDFKFKTVLDSEKSKDLKVASNVISDLAKFDLNKQTFIIALGGGVIGDLSGFVASIYKRGIPYVQIPTTLLGQVDSSIGGKTALDLTEGKNLVGAFFQPSLVFSDILLLKTLDKRQLSSGLAEVIKYGIIKNSKLFYFLEKNIKGILNAEDSSLERIVFNSAKIKAEIVSIDERESKGIRTILNFGHTIGHAIEAASGFKRYNHGEAVALGMLIALDMSSDLGLAPKSLLKRAEILIKNSGLNVKISKVSINNILDKHYRDKKFTGAKNKFVLSCGLGKTKIVKDVPLKIISSAIKRRY